MKTPLFIVILLVVVVVLGRMTVSQHGTAKPQEGGDEGIYHITYVYDGDTVKLNNGEHVRLIGIDTPESHDNPKLRRDVQRLHKDKETILALGRRAAKYSDKLLADQDVRIVFDVEPRDKYKRLLAYVYLLDGTFVNKKIICDGYAYPMTYPPNVRHAKEFKQCFDEAREAKRGLWAQ